MGIFDIFRSRERKEEAKYWEDKINQEIKEKGSFTAYNFNPYGKPRKETKIRKCRSCGSSVKHTCISERILDEDRGGMQCKSQIWAIANHTYKENKKCRDSNRRYKKQFWS